MLASRLHFITLEARYRALSSGDLPPFLGSTLRGAFGHALKDAFCIVRHRDCGRCELTAHCHYVRIFENASPERKRQGFEHTPRPFVLVPPPSREDDRLSLRLRLFGEAPALPHIYFALKRMGERGFGHKRLPFELEVVRDDETKATLWEPGETPATRPQTLLLQEKAVATDDPLRLRFATPVRLTGASKVRRRLDAALLVAAIRRRYEWMHRLYGAFAAEDLDFPDEARIIQDDVRFVHFRRYSNRQRAGHDFGGLMGEFTLSHAPARLRALLACAAYLHVGKNTGFGLGQLEAA